MRTAVGTFPKHGGVSCDILESPGASAELSVVADPKIWCAKLYACKALSEVRADCGE